MDIILEEVKASRVLGQAAARCVTHWRDAQAPLLGPDGGVGTMMPGETPTAPAGTAATGGACASCGVLQQVGTDSCAAGVGFLFTDEVVGQRRAAGGWEKPATAVTAPCAVGNADSVRGKRAL